MKKSLKRKVVIKIKKYISKIVLFFLFRGFKVTCKYDDVVKKEDGKLVKLKIAEKLDLEITFKSIDAAFLMFTGRLGVSKAYAEHRFTLKGEIGKAMSLVRCIDVVEAYLFPKLITKNILKEIPKKSMGLARCYGKVLFGKV